MEWQDVLMKRLLRITGYAARARYGAEISEDFIGWIPRQIGSPYSSGPSHGVHTDQKRGSVIIVETKHRCYDVFAVPPEMKIYATDDEATEAYIAGKRS